MGAFCFGDEMKATRETMTKEHAAGAAHVPSRDEFDRLAREYDLVPVYREVFADLETPVSAFLKIDGAESAYLLESVEGGERLGRYSFMGSNPDLVVTFNDGVATIITPSITLDRPLDDPLVIVKELLDQWRAAPVEGLPPFFGGAVGYVSYEGVRYFETSPGPDRPPITRAAAGDADDLGLPEMVFMFTDTMVIFDHLERRMKIVANARVADGPDAYETACAKIDAIVARLESPLEARHLGPPGASGQGIAPGISSNMTRAQYESGVERIKDYIVAGDAFQVVLSQRFETETDATPIDVYRILRTLNPSPYMFFFRHKGMALVGSSPEPLVKVDADRTVITRPLAGTRGRGATRDEDLALEQDLLADPKERAEHVMLVDLGRNDIGRVAAPGTVEVDDLMAVERYSHVMHIVSNVVGKLEAGKDAFDALRATFPAGTVSGAPKVRAMEIIAELEPTTRGPYAGVVGYFGYNGTLDACITIRTIEMVDGHAYVQAGAGIVADSVPASEYEETVRKAGALLDALALAGASDAPRREPQGGDAA
jgi:anthranilate synthase component 1